MLGSGEPPFGQQAIRCWLRVGTLRPVAVVVLWFSVVSCGMDTESTLQDSDLELDFLGTENTGTIQMERVTLLDSNAPIAGPTTRVVANESGFLVVDPFDPVAVFVYDNGGGFRHTIGRQGSGPGEFSDIAAIASGPGQSVTIVDVGNRRQVVVGPDMSIIREVSLAIVPLKGAMLVLPSGDVLLNGVDRSSVSGSGNVHRIIAATGAPRWSIAPSGTGTNGAVPPTTYALGKSASGGAWAVGSSDYSVRKIDPETGASTLFGTRRMEEWHGATRGHQAPAMPMHVSEDSFGRVWIAVRVPKVDSLPSRRIEQPVTGATYAGLFGTVIEVLDVENRRIMGSTRLDAFPSGLLGPGTQPGEMRLFTYEDQLFSTAIWRARLGDPPER